MIYLLLLLSFSTNADLQKIKMDLNLACELSQLAKKKSQTSKYKNDPNGLHNWILRQFKAKIKNQEIRRLSGTIGLVDEKTREKIWIQTAKDLGVDDWLCPGIGAYL